MTFYKTRVMHLTDKARALFRERRIRNSNTLVTDILWLASAEFGRQRAEGYRMRASDHEREGLLRIRSGAIPTVWTTEQE